MAGFPDLLYGARNGAVLAAQNALHRYLAQAGLPHVNLRNGAFGTHTAEDVGQLRRHAGLPGPDRAIGRHVWEELRPFLSRSDRLRLRGYWAAVAARRAAEATRLRKARGQKVADALLDLYSRGHDVLIYTQARPWPLSNTLAVLRRRLDCSSTVSWGYWRAQMPDPNGFGWRPGQTGAYGFTGTLWANGIPVTPGMEEPGDLAFYGDMGDGVPSHTAGVVLTPKGLIPRVVSFGHTPISVLDLDYRPDYRGCRRYLT